MRATSASTSGSTTTKAVMLDEGGAVLGRGITNSRFNYHLAAEIARDEAHVDARFTLLDRALAAAGETGDEALAFRKRLLHQFRKVQQMAQLATLRTRALEEAVGARLSHLGPSLVTRLERIFDVIETEWKKPRLTTVKGSDSFRDQAASDYSRYAEREADRELKFDALMSVFDKVIILVENERLDLTFEGNIKKALERCLGQRPPSAARATRPPRSPSQTRPSTWRAPSARATGDRRCPFRRTAFARRSCATGSGPT